MLATLVDVDALWRTAWTAAVAGVGVSLIFALTIVGATRSADLRREDRVAPAALYALMALLGAAATLGGVAYGVVLITTK